MYKTRKENQSIKPLIRVTLDNQRNLITRAKDIIIL